MLSLLLQSFIHLLQSPDGISYALSVAAFVEDFADESPDGFLFAPLEAASVEDFEVVPIFCGGQRLWWC